MRRRGRLAHAVGRRCRRVSAQRGDGLLHARQAARPGFQRRRQGSVRRAAVEALSELADPRAVEPLVAATRDAHWEVREAALEALSEMGSDAGTKAVIAGLEDSHWSVRVTAAEALGNIEDARACIAECESLLARVPVDTMVAADPLAYFVSIDLVVGDRDRLRQYPSRLAPFRGQFHDMLTDRLLGETALR